MTAPSAVGSLLGFETFGTAVGLSLVVGALSLVAPMLTVLAGTLAALAIAGSGFAPLPGAPPAPVGRFERPLGGPSRHGGGSARLPRPPLGRHAVPWPGPGGRARPALGL